MTESPLNISLKATICVSHSCSQKGSQNVEVSKQQIIQVLMQNKSILLKLCCSCLIEVKTLQALLKQPCMNSSPCKNMIINWKSSLQGIKPAECCIECYIKSNQKMVKDNGFMKNKIQELRQQISNLQADIERKKAEVFEKKELLEQRENQAKALKIKVVQLQTKLRNQIKRCQQFEEQNKQKHIQMNLLKDSIQKKHLSVLSNKDRQIDRLKEQNLSYKKQLDQMLNSQHQKLSENQANLPTDNQKIKSEQKTYKKVEKERSDKDKTQLQTQKENLIENMLSEIDLKAKKINQLEQKIASLEKKVGQLSVRQQTFKEKLKNQTKSLKDMLQRQRQMEDIFDQTVNDSTQNTFLNSTTTNNQTEQENLEQVESPLFWYKKNIQLRLSHADSSDTFSPSTGQSCPGEMKNSSDTKISEIQENHKTDYNQQNKWGKIPDEEEQKFEDPNGQDFLDAVSIQQSEFNIDTPIQVQISQSLKDKAKYGKQTDETNPNPKPKPSSFKYEGNQVLTGQTTKTYFKNDKNPLVDDVSKTHTPSTSSSSNDSTKEVVWDPHEKNFIKIKDTDKNDPSSDDFDRQ